MKNVVTAAAMLVLLPWALNTHLGAVVAASSATDPLRCIAFGPYITGYDPNTGPHPSPSLIDKLLDRLIGQTNFRCIMTYGVLNGLDYTFEAAGQRNIKVIAIIWLGADPAVNKDSIETGVRAAKAYPETIVRVSCGDEVRTQAWLQYGSDDAMDAQINLCIDTMRANGVIQPITVIDTWWEWCSRTYPCQRNAFADKLDWIGINVYPWRDNKDSGLFPCTPAAQAPSFHINRIRDVRTTYPGKDVVITEFGWPAGPEGYSEVNHFTGQKCGIASETAQTNVIARTIAKLDTQKWSGVVFEAFREPWKATEGAVGPYWGICETATPYTCKPVIDTKNMERLR